MSHSQDDIPAEPLQQALFLQDLLIARATGNHVLGLRGDPEENQRYRNARTREEQLRRFLQV